MAIRLPLPRSHFGDGLTPAEGRDDFFSQRRKLIPILSRRTTKPFPPVPRSVEGTAASSPEDGVSSPAYASTSTAAWALQRVRRTADSFATVKLLLVCGLVGLLYGDVVWGVVQEWGADPDYSHGFLVVLLAGYVAWIQREPFLAEPAAPDRRGVALTAFGCSVYLAGILGAEFFLTRVSSLMLMTGLAWTFWGFRRVRHFGFPLLLLVTVIPLPAILYHQVALPLQILASGVSTSILQVFGVPVFQEGNVIHLADVQLGIEEACSGLRSVSSLTVLALIIGYLDGYRRGTRLLLFAMAFPVAIFTNLCRVAGTAVLAEYYDATMAIGFYHSFTGWLVFVVGFGMLYIVGKSLGFFLERARGPLEATGS